MFYLFFFFFFQAEDGIRDVAVTGVQTCALPISKEPAVGCAAAISARAHIIGKAINAPATKLRITAGPASFTAMALPRNSPVPMVLPRPSMASCAGLRLRSRPDSRATMVAARLSSTAISEGSSLMARHPNRNLTFVLLLASFELDVRTVNERNTDPLKKRSLLVSCTLESEAWRGTGTRRHGGRHETPARFDCHLHRHVFRCDSGIVAKFRERSAASLGFRTRHGLRAIECEHRSAERGGHSFAHGTSRGARYGRRRSQQRH